MAILAEPLVCAASCHVRFALAEGGHDSVGGDRVPRTKPSAVVVLDVCVALRRESSVWFDFELLLDGRELHRAAA
jgi:hypothetical protein